MANASGSTRPRGTLRVVERLTATTWLFSVLPLLTGRRGDRVDVDRAVYYIDATPGGLLASRATGPLVGVRVARLDFRLADIRDEDRNLIRLRGAYFDFAEVEREILKSDEFSRLSNDPAVTGRMVDYIAKRTAFYDIHTNVTVWRALFLIQVVAAKAKVRSAATPSVLFMSRKVWQAPISDYGRRSGVTVVPVTQFRLDLRGRVRRGLGSRFLEGRAIVHCLLCEGPAGLVRAWRRRNSTAAGARLAIDFTGHLNLDRPELYSDAFFWQRSELSGEDIIVSFKERNDPVDDGKQAELAVHGMRAVALSPRARKTRSVPAFYHLAQTRGAAAPRALAELTTAEARWMLAQAQRYQAERGFWGDLFERTGTKVYVTWFKQDAAHIAIADAIAEAGGVLAIHQRSFEEFSSPELAMTADVAFLFSHSAARVEAGNGSMVPYAVITGYLGDHRFALLKGWVREHVREPLDAAGARHVVAFFDENSGDDPRWHTGHEFMRVNYAFLLERLLATPELGLVFKPKVPATLRHRLGPVRELLERAEATGRCVVLEGGAMHGSYPPAAAALAADVAIHGHLCAATAGLEAALAGVPTLLMDREGWPLSSLYRLGRGRVVFTDWDEAWQAVTDHLAAPGAIPGFGDWSELLPELDPFRDGRAAERMGTYLSWLLDGFKAGRDRETALADAAERYVATWGEGTVVSVGGGTTRPIETPAGTFDTHGGAP